uniref:Protein TIFY 4B isoform X3 n=1 Tax=Rhizophora mucronata TaxID=61149 RepID=A0A2P2ITL0_RHIMU
MTVRVQQAESCLYRDISRNEKTGEDSRAGKVQALHLQVWRCI